MNPELLSYVAQARQQGKVENDIRKELQELGTFRLIEIESAINLSPESLQSNLKKSIKKDLPTNVPINPLANQKEPKQHFSFFRKKKSQDLSRIAETPVSQAAFSTPSTNSIPPQPNPPATPVKRIPIRSLSKVQPASDPTQIPENFVIPVLAEKKRKVKLNVKLNTGLNYKKVIIAFGIILVVVGIGIFGYRLYKYMTFEVEPLPQVIEIDE